jgi:Mg2+ and Co2+ transporter CorA
MSRLTMQYTVDIEEIEDEVARLLSKANTTLKEISEEFARLSHGSVMSYGRIEKIDELRRRLTSMDHNLNDSSNIIQGYLSYKAALIAKREQDDWTEEQNEIPASD